MPSMPVLPLEQMCGDLNCSGEKLIHAAFNGRGQLRVRKPYRKIDYGADDALFKASANYVWRMLCWNFVDWVPHCCLPATADWDIAACYNQTPEGYKKSAAIRKDLINRLDEIIKAAEAVLPATAQKGAMRWARAGLV